MKTIVTTLTLVSISLILVGIFPPQSSAKIDKKTIVGLWLFEGGSGKVALDTSGNGNDGEFVGAPKRVKGQFGKALEIGGQKDYVDCGDIDALDFGDSDFTISVWVKAAATGAGELGNGYSRIVDKTYTTGFSLMRSAGRAQIQFEVGGNAQKTISSDVLDEKWHHIVAIRHDNTKGKIYIDGELDVEGPLVGGDIGNDDHFCIGYDCPFKTRALKGLIDEVVIFDVALEDDDIEKIMTDGLEKTLDVSPAGKLATAWGAIKAQ